MLWAPAAAHEVLPPQPVGHVARRQDAFASLLLLPGLPLLHGWNSTKWGKSFKPHCQQRVLAGLACQQHSSSLQRMQQPFPAIAAAAAAAGFPCMNSQMTPPSSSPVWWWCCSQFPHARFSYVVAAHCCCQRGASPGQNRGKGETAAKYDTHFGASQYSAIHTLQYDTVQYDTVRYCSAVGLYAA